MARFLAWWKGGLSPWVKFALLLLVLNGVPAFIILMTLPHMTENLFVWTVRPVVNARLLGVMYGNALLLVIFAYLQSSWPRARIIVLLIAYFSIAATLMTFVNINPFLQHPWFHLAYWLTMYLALCVVAPAVFIWQERKFGGRLAIERPLSGLARAAAALSVVVCGVTGVGLIFSVGTVNQVWPWTITPLVGAIVGVWFTALAVAFAYALWDGDWVRTRPMFWQAVPTGIALALLWVLHPFDARSDAGVWPGLYLALSLGAAALFALVIVRQERGR